MTWERTTSGSSITWEAFVGGASVATILHERGSHAWWLWLPASPDGVQFGSLAAARKAAETHA